MYEVKKILYKKKKNLKNLKITSMYEVEIF